VARYTKVKPPEPKAAPVDLKQPDEIHNRLEAFFQALVRYRVWLLTALAFVVLAIIAGSVIASRVQGTRDAMGAQVSALLAEANAPALVEEADAAKVKDAGDKLLAKLEPVLAAHEREAVALPLRMLKASVLLRTAQYEQAVPVLESIQQDANVSLVALPVVMALAGALEGKGDLAGAGKLLEERGKVEQTLARLIISKELGDLYNPSMGAGAGQGFKDREKALHHYNEALVLLQDKGGSSPDRLEEFYRNEIQKRIALLKG
jgi:hypothetical protein